MNAVGIDVSKGKSTVTVRRPGGIVIMSLHDIPHTQSAVNALINLIRGLDGETKVKTMNRQFGFYMAQKTAMKNNLISLLDQTYPGANDFFDSPARSDGRQKWVDFVHTYWHVDCVCSKSPEDFTQHY